MKKKKGLTLIEVVVSMALIGMVAVVFLTIFNTSNKNIFNAGKRTDDILVIQEIADFFTKHSDFINENELPEILQKIQEERDVDLENIKIELTVKEEFNVEIGGINEPIFGKLVTIREEKIRTQKEIEITTFVPAGGK